MPARALFYRIERQNGSLNFRIWGIAGHGDLAALLAIDLNHQRHRVFNQQITFDFGPIGFGNQARLLQYPPAFLREMRHHRREQLNQDYRGLANGPRQIGGRLSLARQHVPKRVGKLPDIGKADIEVQPFDPGGDPLKRAVRGLPRRPSHRRQTFPAVPLAQLWLISADSLTSRQSRCTKRDAPCTRSSLQITSRSGGESDSMNQRATSAP